MRQTDGPPRLADWFLRRCLPPGGKGDSIRGDLHEEFADSTRWKRLRFWATALEIGAGYLAARHLQRPKVPDKTSRHPGKELASVRQDFRYGFRTLLKNPGFTVVAVLTLALGIGANAMIFSVVNGVVLRALPYPQPDRLVRIWPNDQLSQLVVEALDSRSGALQGCAGSTGMRSALTGTDQPEELYGAAVTAKHFSVLGVSPLLGRSFTAEDARPSAAPVVILSHGLWQRRFGADQSILGRNIQLGSQQRAVIGILSADYRPLDPQWEFWTPLIADPASPVYAGRTWLTAVARLAEGTDRRQAQAEVHGIAEGIAQSDPATYGAGWVESGRVVPLQDAMVDDVKSILWILQGTVGFVFLIACTNLANLLLARGAGRSREMAVRSALGAGRWQVVRLLLAESLLLGILGGVAGLLAAAWAVSAFSGSFPSGFPLTERIAIDARVAAFTLLISLLAAVLFGLGPALRASRRALRPALQQGRDSQSSSVGQSRWSGTLVAVEIALSFVLLTGAGLMIKSFATLRAVDPGFRAERLLSMRLSPRYERYSGGDRISAFYRSVIERVQSLPAVTSAGAIHLLPLASSGFNFTYFAQDNPVPPGTPRPTTSVRLVMPGYFRSMGIPLLKGRLLEDSDQSEAPAVALVNQSLARRLWPAQEAVGKEIRFFSLEEPPVTVVGVVGDVRQLGLQTESVPETYLPLAQYPWSTLYLTLRTSEDPLQLIPEVRQAVWTIDKDVAISQIRPMEQVVSGNIADSRFYTLLITLFAILALSLGCLGVYGVMACSVRRRRHEIGIRMALGAASGRLMRTTLSSGLRPVALGLLAGIPSAALAARTLSATLYQVAPLDPSVFALMALFLLAVAATAIYLPSRRATRVDPMTVLRNP